MGSDAYISTGSSDASNAARDILSDGGNAYDAAIAAVFTSMVSEPCLTSPGGGGVLLGSMGGNVPEVYNFFVDYPNNINRSGLDFFSVRVDFGDTTQDFNIGKGSIAVPGNVRGLLDAHADNGRLSRSDVIAPAILCARSGARINRTQAYVIDILKDVLGIDRVSRELFFRSGELLKEGDTFYNPRLASFFELISSEQGGNSFYSGDISISLLDFLADGGSVSSSALRRYKTLRQRPLASNVKGYETYTAPGPAVGGFLVQSMLRLISRLDKRDVTPMSLASIIEHSGMIKSYLLGSDDMESDMDRLASDRLFLNLITSREYHSDRFKSSISGVGMLGSTTHVSVIDRDMNAVTVTTTNGAGCGYVVPEFGFMMNNMLGEDDLNPQGISSWEAGSRIPTMMAPTMLFKDGKVSCVLGSGGSSRIKSAIFQVLVNIIFKGMTLEDAVSAPRLHIENDILYTEPGVDLSLDVSDICRFSTPNLFFGGVNAVSSSAAVSDSRRSGSAYIV